MRNTMQSKLAGLNSSKHGEHGDKRFREFMLSMQGQFAMKKEVWNLVSDDRCGFLMWRLGIDAAPSHNL